MEIDYSSIKKLKEIVNSVEKRINTFESNGYIESGLEIPPVNELRYSLEHLLRYLTGTEDSVNGAIKHSRRALYDSYEIELVHHFRAFQKFESANVDILLKDVCPHYFDWAEKFDEIRHFIKTTDKNNRDQYYETLEIMLKGIEKFPHQLRAAEQEAAKKRNENEKNKESLKIAQKNLEIAQNTVKIRTYALAISLSVALISLVALFLKN